MQPFTMLVIEQIKAIPAGKVMTYGGIAAAAGSPRAARQVVRILHSMSGKYQLPWHRVVNAKGEIALMDDESRFMQQSLLKDEGVEFIRDGRIDLSVYGM
ncbi:MGMT family protein [Paenibacillus dokdonensis]|uniref:MGMT family protein n=1 Tax=Paenibacillus dokdonensis TaxID=2567944 RepID=A0ABU6GR19_9BACL|nr:MGMT family protein [Paenibacillus dokdonensis]MEC0241165.1 MGMT family protein [Paenibacillus dokdonensis]